MGSGKPAAARPERIPSRGKWRGPLSKALKFLTILGFLLVLGKIDLFGTSGATAIHSEKMFYQVYSTFLGDEKLYVAEEPDSDQRKPISVRDIAVFLITDAGLSEREGWPPSFRYHMRNLIRIAKQEPRAIFVDIVFRQTKDRKGAEAFGKLIKKIADGELTRGRKIKVYLAATDIRPLKRPSFRPCSGLPSPALGPKDVTPPVSATFLRALENGSIYFLEPEKRKGLFLWDKSRFSDQIELVSVQSAGFYRRGIEYQATDFWNNRRTAAVAIYKDAMAIQDDGTNNNNTIPGLVEPDCTKRSLEELTFQIGWSTRDLSDLNWPWDIDRERVINQLRKEVEEYPENYPKNYEPELVPAQYYDCRNPKNVPGEDLSSGAVPRVMNIIWRHTKEAAQDLGLHRQPLRPDDAPPWVETSADVMLRQSCPPHLTMPDYDLVEVRLRSLAGKSNEEIHKWEGPLRDRFVFYGAATQVAADLIDPPTHEPLPGVYLHAMAFETLLRTNGNPRGLDKKTERLSALVFAGGLFFLLLASEGFDFIWRTYFEHGRGKSTTARLLKLGAMILWLPLLLAASSAIALLTLIVGFRLMNLPPTNFLGLFGLLLVRRVPNLRNCVDWCGNRISVLWDRFLEWWRESATEGQFPADRRHSLRRFVVKRFVLLRRMKGTRL